MKSISNKIGKKLHPFNTLFTLSSDYSYDSMLCAKVTATIRDRMPRSLVDGLIVYPPSLHLTLQRAAHKRIKSESNETSML